MKLLLENWKRFLTEGKKVKIFRAQPAFTKVIRKNDYVTLSRKFAGDHAVTSAIYNDEPFYVVYAFVDEDKIKEADNPGEYRYIGEDFEAKPSQIADTEGNLRFARNLRETEEMNESIDLDIEVGDILLGGKYKNKRTVVKEIGEDDIGQPTINGKPLLNFRIEKQLPDSKKSKQTLEDEKKKT